MKRLTPLVFLVLSAMGGAEGVKPIDNADIEMNVAIRRAKESLDTFLKLKSNPPTGVENFQVKVRFASGEVVEHMWVSPFRSALGTGYEGLLRNEPRNIPSLRLGQQVKFSADQITDWGYTKEGKRFGYFTTCVLFARDKSPESQKQRTELGYQCQL
jgi:uncharacterized protein YegJ (DUF2314 family)